MWSADIALDGGADGDVFQNLGSAGAIDFSGEDGADVFINEIGAESPDMILVDAAVPTATCSGISGWLG